MRPCVQPPLSIKATVFGGPKPLFCIPLVGRDSEQLLAQAHFARNLKPDVLEWRADAYDGINAELALKAAGNLRTIFDTEPILFTLRIHSEGGMNAMTQDVRLRVIE